MTDSGLHKDKIIHLKVSVLLLDKFQLSLSYSFFLFRHTDAGTRPEQASEGGLERRRSLAGEQGTAEEEEQAWPTALRGKTEEVKDEITNLVSFSFTVLVNIRK